MDAEILYRPIKNGYARITDQGRIQLTIPQRLKNNETFVQELYKKAQGLLRRHQQRTHLHTINEQSVLLFGEEVPLEDITSSSKGLAPKLKEILYEYAKPILDEYSEQLGFAYKELKIRKTTAKRGSCTHDQRITLNLSLVHLPTRLTQYVIIHEACHLQVKNHSSHFRNLVERYCPKYKLLRKELRNYILH